MNARQWIDECLQSTIVWRSASEVVRGAFRVDAVDESLVLDLLLTQAIRAVGVCHDTQRFGVRDASFGPGSDGGKRDACFRAPANRKCSVVFMTQPRISNWITKY